MNINTFKNKAWSVLKLKSVYFPLIALIVIVGATKVLGGNKKSAVETMTVQPSTFSQQVSVTGKVVSAQDVDMSFESGGRVSVVNIDVGQHVKAGQSLSVVDSGDAYASYLQRQAALEAEQARLNAMLAGTRPEELAIAQTSYDQAKNAIMNAITSGFTTTDDAIRIKTDQLYTDPRKINPKIIYFDNYDLKTKLETERVTIGTLLDAWSASVNKLQSAGYSDSYLAEAKSNLVTIKAYLDEINIATGSIQPATTIPQSTIDKYRSDASIARSNIVNAITTLNSAENSFRSAGDQLALKKAGSRPEDIDAERANVKSAQANLLSAQAQLSQRSINAPFDGVITKVDAKIGQIVSPSVPVISMISDSALEIEAYIPEADIAKVQLKQTAKVWLDSYGPDNNFDAVVTSIDPAETVVEGVATYKTKLQFTKTDDRVRSGMTANIDIQTDNREGVISIPARAVVNTNGVKTVYVVVKGSNNSSSTSNQGEARVVETGSTDTKGNTEIKTGLKAGDIIITNPVRS